MKLSGGDVWVGRSFYKIILVNKTSAAHMECSVLKDAFQAEQMCAGAKDHSRVHFT